MKARKTSRGDSEGTCTQQFANLEFGAEQLMLIVIRIVSSWWWYALFDDKLFVVAIEHVE